MMRICFIFLLFFSPSFVFAQGGCKFAFEDKTYVNIATGDNITFKSDGTYAINSLFDKTSTYEVKDCVVYLYADKSLVGSLKYSTAALSSASMFEDKAKYNCECFFTSTGAKMILLKVDKK